jgi:hypothetical protein
MSATSQVERLRRQSIATSAACAALAAVPGLTVNHGHRILGLVCIGVQAVLLVFSLRFYFESKRLAASKQV